MAGQTSLADSQHYIQAEVHVLRQIDTIEIEWTPNCGYNATNWLFDNFQQTAYFQAHVQTSISR